MNRLLALHRRLATAGAQSFAEWLLFCCLLPFGVLYGIIGWLRAYAYASGLARRYRAAVPVVSVGNLQAGGTGKTPVVDWLVKEFHAQGKKVAVLSRGYGGSFSGSVAVVSDGEQLHLGAAEAGDEPVLLANRNPGLIVVIARKRMAAAKLASERFGVDVLVLDDGFQHLPLKRDLDIVLLDARHPLGNGWPLPAGLLREFPLALKRADLFLLTRAAGKVAFSIPEKPLFHSSHQLSDVAIAQDGTALPLADFKGKKLCAFAGIADPQAFFEALTALGLVLEKTLALSDHCCYDKQTIATLTDAASDCDLLLTTEKDAVKLEQTALPLPCYRLPLTIRIAEEERFRQILQEIWR